MASIFPNRFCSNLLTHPGHFYFGFRAEIIQFKNNAPEKASWLWSFLGMGAHLSFLHGIDAVSKPAPELAPRPTG